MAYLNPTPSQRFRASAANEFAVPRLHRQPNACAGTANARRRGLRCLTIELSDMEIAALIRMGLLSVETRNNPRAIGDALYEHFERTLALIS